MEQSVSLSGKQSVREKKIYSAKGTGDSVLMLQFFAEMQFFQVASLEEKGLLGYQAQVHERNSNWHYTKGSTFNNISGHFHHNVLRLKIFLKCLYAHNTVLWRIFKKQNNKRKECMIQEQFGDISYKYCRNLESRNKTVQNEEVL